MDQDCSIELTLDDFDIAVSLCTVGYVVGTRKGPVFNLYVATCSTLDPQHLSAIYSCVHTSCMNI